MRRLSLLVSLLLVACPVAARMYEWVNPATGRTQLSGHPPAWYRSETPGPRVVVFESGQIVDDTAIAVSDDRRQQLRQEAFRGAAPAAAAAAEPDNATPEATAPAAADKAASADFSEPSAATEAPAASASEPPTDETIARLKALIEQWDRRKTEEAKSLIQQQAAPAQAAPAPP